MACKPYYGKLIRVLMKSSVGRQESGEEFARAKPSRRAFCSRGDYLLLCYAAWNGSMIHDGSCNLAHGGSVRDCGCRLPNLAGWAECPQEARRRPLPLSGVGWPASARDEFESNLVHETSRASGFTGDQCSNCGSMQMVYNGTCMLCLSCGVTSGCS
jgi:hypothetical protein